MKQNQKNIPDFDDLIFESRNKEYGAFEIRKRYNCVLIACIIIASFLGSSAVVIPFLIEKSSNRVIASGLRYLQVQMDSYIPPEEEFHLPAPPSLSLQIKEIQYVAPEVVDTINTIEKMLATNDEALTHAGDTNIAGDGSSFGDDLFSGEGGPGAGEVYFMVEQNPSFMGGDINRFRQWVQRRAIYPQEAIENKIKGTVFITFIVEKDGSVSNVALVKGVHPLLDNEALRVISESPRWDPGLQRGQAVRVRFSISLTF